MEEGLRCLSGGTGHEKNFYKIISDLYKIYKNILCTIVSREVNATEHRPDCGI